MAAAFVSGSPLRDALRIGRQLWEEFEARGCEFALQEYHDELARRLQSHASHAFAGFVNYIVQRVDSQATTSSDEQQTLFDLEGVYKLGNTHRIPKRSAKLSHIRRALEIDDNNLGAVMAANQRKHDELNRLLPYWEPYPHRSKARVIEAYLADHPEASA